MINSFWFVLLTFMLAGYAVLDGFDLVGILHLLLGRNTRDRGVLIDAIGPVWNGNEVWLLGAGGSMIVAFPHLYVTSQLSAALTHPTRNRIIAPFRLPFPFCRCRFCNFP
jgi:cytochrome bd-type quinol oxidase subunit 2